VYSWTNERAFASDFAPSIRRCIFLRNPFNARCFVSLMSRLRHVCVSPYVAVNIARSCYEATYNAFRLSQASIVTQTIYRSPSLFISGTDRWETSAVHHVRALSAREEDTRNSDGPSANCGFIAASSTAPFVLITRGFCGM